MHYTPSILREDIPSPMVIQRLSGFTKVDQNPDIHFVSLLDEKTSLSIDQVHKLLPTIAYTPVQERYKLVLITTAHLLTLPAQNAVLKTLEEPPINTRIILCTSKPAMLLSTILSRCQEETMTFDTTRSKQEDGKRMYEEFLGASIAKAISLSDVIGNKEKALEKLEGMLLSVSRIPVQTKKTIHHQTLLIEAIERIQRNINIKLTIDTLIFQMMG